MRRLMSKRSPEPIPATESLWNVQELARFIKKTPHAIYKMVQLRQIPHLKIGQAVRFDPHAIRAWLAKHAVPAVDSRWAHR